MFSKKPAAMAGADRMPTTRIGGGGTFSVLGADLVVRGDITAETDLHIDGRVEGDVTCAALVLGESGRLEGALRARSARLAGSVHGAIDVADLVIEKTARISGDVAYDTLTVEQGAQVDGRFTPRGSNAAAAAPEALLRQA